MNSSLKLCFVGADSQLPLITALLAGTDLGWRCKVKMAGAHRPDSPAGHERLQGGGGNFFQGGEWPLPTQPARPYPSSTGDQYCPSLHLDLKQPSQILPVFCLSGGGRGRLWVILQ